MEKKIAIVLWSGLEGWQLINVASHLCVAIGRYGGADIMGKNPLMDASGVAHMGICRYPIVALRAARPSQVREVLERARKFEGILTADYPRQMLSTYYDGELVAALAKETETTLEYLGVALLGSTDSLKRLTGSLPLLR